MLSVDLFSDPRLTLTALALRGRVETPLLWNSFPGSVIHGALGFTLKQHSCIASHGQCPGCYAAADCAYAQLLETPPAPDAERLRSHRRILSPLSLSVAPWPDDRLEPGDELTIRFTLIGTSSRFAVPVLVAMAAALETGLGRANRAGQRGIVRPLSLTDIPRGTTTPWPDLRFDDSGYINPISWADLLAQSGSPSTLIFRSPTRIQSGGHIKSRPTWRDLLAAALRRIGNLAYFHCGVELEANYRAALDQVSGVNSAIALNREAVNRYSGRQRRRIHIDGLTGAVTIPEELEAFKPWLRMLEWVGIGKGTSMGLGQCECN